MPLVSVVIPTYNRGHLIREALESVFAQTFTDYEVILIDDGSTDQTEKIIRESYLGRLRYVAQENRGISAARNRGIELAKGKYIAFLDSDDKWLPEKLEKQAAYLEANPDTALLCTKLYRYEIGNEEKKVIDPPEFPQDFAELLNGKNYIPTTTVMIRRACFEAVGVFDPALPVCEDWDLWLRITTRFGFYCLPDVLAEHRDHARKTTRDLSKVYEGYWLFYTKCLNLYRPWLVRPDAYEKRAVSFEYLFGTACLKKGDMQKALKHIRHALKTRGSVGTYFDTRKSFFGRPILFIKPYIALIYSLIGATFSPLWRSKVQ